MTASMSSCIRSASAEPKAADRNSAARAQQRDCWRRKRTDATGYVHVRGGPGARRGRAVAGAAGRQRATGRRLRLPQSESPAFDLSDRGVAGRSAPAGLDAFVYTERGVYRSGETVHVTALLRDPAGVAAPDAPLTLVVERPDGVEYRRAVLPDQGAGGRALERADHGVFAPTGTWRVQAFTDPKRPPVGEASFLVEDYVPDRLEFDAVAEARRNRPRQAGGDRARRPLISTARRPRRSISKARW